MSKWSCCELLIVHVTASSHIPATMELKQFTRLKILGLVKGSRVITIEACVDKIDQILMDITYFEVVITFYSIYITGILVIRKL